jgi:hypothetical protein
VINLGGDHLQTAVSVGDADGKSVLRGKVLVLVLGDELVAATIVGVAGC